MSKAATRIEIEGVNDGGSRGFWFVMTLLSVLGVSKSLGSSWVEEDTIYLFLFRFVGISVIAIYMMVLVRCFSSDPPIEPYYKADRVVRFIVPLLVLMVLHFSLRCYQTCEAFLFIFSVIYGGIAVVQLLYPVEGFHVGYVLLMVFMGVSAGVLGMDYDPTIQPSWLWIPTIGTVQSCFYFLNFPDGFFKGRG